MKETPRPSKHEASLLPSPSPSPSPLDQFRDHVGQVLSNFHVVVEGFDAPKVFTQFGLPIVHSVLDRCKDLGGLGVDEVLVTNKCGADMRFLQLSSAHGIEMQFGPADRAAFLLVYRDDAPKIVGTAAPKMVGVPFLHWGTYFHGGTRDYYDASGAVITPAENDAVAQKWYAITGEE